LGRTDPAENREWIRVFPSKTLFDRRASSKDGHLSVSLKWDLDDKYREDLRVSVWAVDPEEWPKTGQPRVMRVLTTLTKTQRMILDRFRDRHQLPKVVFVWYPLSGASTDGTRARP
jgi:hypothetical protein